MRVYLVQHGQSKSEEPRSKSRSISRSRHRFFFINASENAVHRKRGIVKILAKALGDR